MITAMVAVGALVGVKVQIDANDRAQALQSARAAYLAQQALAVQNPKFAQPQAACSLLESPDAMAYESFVTHLLFTAEQMLTVTEGWEPTFLYEFMPHATYLCQNARSLNVTVELQALLTRFEAESCAAVPSCP